MSFNHQEIEKKWQKKWKEDSVNLTPDNVEDKENVYLLVEFPYPSGNLHIGHWYSFAVPDIWARFQRLQGKNALYPFGFDSFGLPAENAAIKRGLDPKEWTYSNIETMLNQISMIGASFDLSRMVITSDPTYYKWTQWIFTKMLENDLAYRAEGAVEWCPSCKTVLAHEQVVGGECERCGATIEKKTMNQWMLRITRYADRLIDDLDHLSWPDAIKEAQKNWIGRSKGAEIDFKIQGTNETITVFTTRPDTIFGATYMVLAPEHEIVQNVLHLISNAQEVELYISKAQAKTDIERQQGSKEKSGVKLEGIRAINPATHEEIPIFIADYVLAGYGTGAIMAVPAHDERDAEFAEVMGLSVKKVVDENGVLINSGDFTGRNAKEAQEEIAHRFGNISTTYRLRDWSVGRQRYWGCPIPVVYNPEGQPHPIPAEHLPWTLPSDVDHTPTGEPPLARSQELKRRTEEIFGEGWTPEVETMDTFVDSSWYFLRYLDPRNESELVSKEKFDTWMPIDVYSGGAEHTTLHVLYSRFFYKVLSDLGIVSGKEPYTYRFNRSLILGPDGQKMSKSKGNVIDPGDQVERVGADAVRMYLAFLGPYNVVSNYPYDLGGIAGTRRFLERVWRLKNIIVDSTESSPEALKKYHRTLKRVSEETEGFKFNTAIASLMELISVLEKESKIGLEMYRNLLVALSPFAPYIAEELWHQIGEEGSVHNQKFPSVDESYLVDDIVTLAVQINGKVRGTVQVPHDASEEKVLEVVHISPELSGWIKGKEIQKVVYIQGRIINLVIH